MNILQAIKRWLRRDAEKESTVRALLYAFHFEDALRLLERGVPEMKERSARGLQKAIRYNQARIEAESDVLPLSGEAVNRAGSWTAKWSRRGVLDITGTVVPECTRVAVFVNERIIKFVNTEASARGNKRKFRFLMKRTLLRSLPRKTRVGIGSESGYLKLKGGGWHLRDERLNGNGTLFRKLGKKDYFVTKKGKLQRSFAIDETWKQRALSAYTEFSAYFNETFGYRPFLICGTLLGYYREGDFIAHDDDLDVAYFSRHSRPEVVKEEMKSMVMKLLSDGFDIQLSLKRGFFKPKINGIRFDVFPMWADQGNIWMMNTTRQAAGRELVEPLTKGQFRGVEVHVPNQVERYLENEYGPDWNIPDPGYRPLAEPGTIEYLRRSCLDVAELSAFHEQYRRTAEENHDIGRLSVIGSVNKKAIKGQIHPAASTAKTRSEKKGNRQ